MSDFGDPMDCSLTGSSVREILQARTLEWVAVRSSRGSSWHRDRTQVSYVSCIGRWVLYHQHHLGNHHSHRPTQCSHRVPLPWVSSFLCTQEKGFDFFVCVSSPDISVLDITTLILWSGKESTCQYRRHGLMPWRRKWQPTPVFLPGKSHGQRSLTSYIVHKVAKESDVT